MLVINAIIFTYILNYFNIKTKYKKQKSRRDQKVST